MRLNREIPWALVALLMVCIGLADRFFVITRVPPGSAAAAAVKSFEQDRAAILAMVGDFRVTSDFRETLAFDHTYKLKAPLKTDGQEIVRAIRDDGNFISLQHIAVAPDGTAAMLGRQDWIYEPREIVEYAGNNSWRKHKLKAAERKGKWAQLVFHVDGSPRYGAVAEWRHENGVSSWTSPPTLKPMPVRDASTRTDYDAVLAVNRYALTPTGWALEADNSKLIMGDKNQILVREVGITTYQRSTDFPAAKGDAYWQITKDFWAIVQAEWTGLLHDNDVVRLTAESEAEPLDMSIPALADDYKSGKLSRDQAGERVKDIIANATVLQK